MDVTAEIEEAHQKACDAGAAHYVDPVSGYNVFTKDALARLSECCGNACRHCPFGHLEVTPERRSADTGPKTVLLAQHRKGRKPKLTVGKKWDTFEDTGLPRQILFWSGGKDSFLTLRALQQENRRALEAGQEPAGPVTLLTTFDGASGIIAFQDTKITDVLLQARREGLDVLVVPLRKEFGPTLQSYKTTMLAALKPLRIKCLAFGDLHLQDLRAWREQTFGAAFPLKFPVFGVPYDELLSKLWTEIQNGVDIRVSAVSPNLAGTEGLEVGRVYDESFIKGLPQGVDIMGENGEFHTHVSHCETFSPDDEGHLLRGGDETTEDSESSDDGSESSESACFSSNSVRPT